MKTLTHSPEASHLKDTARHEYERRHQRSQDHGTRSTTRHKETYGKSTDERRATEADLTLPYEVTDAILERLSPGQLEKAASEILWAAGLEADEADFDFFEDALEQQERDQAQLYVHGDPDTALEYAEQQAEMRQEIQGALNSGQAVRSDAAHLYEGVVDEGYADYLSGYHLTDRP